MSSNRRGLNTTQGFTLMEILIAISIMGIVALLAVGLQAGTQRQASILSGQTGATNILNYISGSITSGKTIFMPTKLNEVRSFNYGELSPAMGNATGSDYADPGIYRAEITYKTDINKTFRGNSITTVKVAQFLVNVCWKTISGSGETCSDQLTYGPIPTAGITPVTDDTTTNTSTSLNRLNLFVDADPYDSGFKPAVTVNGPNGWTKTYTRLGISTEVGIPNGSYTVKATPVVFGGYTYQPFVTTERITSSRGYYESINVSYKIGTAQLGVSVVGVPAGQTPKITVTGTGGYIKTLSGTQTLKDLPPGTYNFLAEDIKVSSYTYSASYSSNPVVLKPGDNKNTTITYASASGALDLKITPPSGMLPKVTVTGPSPANTYKNSFTSSQVVSNLNPGYYSISAEGITDANGTSYQATVTASPAEIKAGESRTVTVTYSAVSTSLTVNVDAPAGILKTYTLNGPNGYTSTQSVDTRSRTEKSGFFRSVLQFKNLQPGAYTLLTDNVEAYNTTYRPVVTPNPITLYAGKLAEMNVTYVVYASVLSINTDAPVAFDRASGIVLRQKSNPSVTYTPQDKPQTVFYNVTPGDYLVELARSPEADLYPGKPSSWVRWGNYFLSINPVPVNFTVEPGSITTVNVPWTYGTGSLSVKWTMFDGSELSSELNPPSLNINAPLQNKDPSSVQKSGNTTTYHLTVPGTYAANASVTCKTGSPRNAYCIPGTDTIYPPFVVNADQSYTVQPGETTNLNLQVSFHGGVEGTITYPDFMKAPLPKPKITLKGATYGKTYVVDSDGSQLMDLANNLPQFRRIFPDTYTITPDTTSFLSPMTVNPSSPPAEQYTADTNVKLQSSLSSVLIRPLQNRTLDLRYAATDTSLYVQKPKTDLPAGSPLYQELLQALKAKVTIGSTVTEMAPDQFRNRLLPQTVTVELPAVVTTQSGTTFTLANLDSDRVRRFTLTAGVPTEVPSTYYVSSRKITVTVNSFGVNAAVPAFTVATQDGTFSQTYTLSNMTAVSTSTTPDGLFSYRTFQKDISVPNGKNQNITVKTSNENPGGDANSTYFFVLNKDAWPTLNYEQHMDFINNPLYRTRTLVPGGADSATINTYPNTYTLTPVTSYNVGNLPVFIYSRGALKSLTLGTPEGKNTARVPASTYGLWNTTDAFNQPYLYVQLPTNDSTVNYTGELRYSSKLGSVTGQMTKKTLSGRSYLVYGLDKIMTGTTTTLNINVKSDYKTVVLTYRQNNPAANTFTARVVPAGSANPTSPLDPLTGTETRLQIPKNGSQTIALFAKTVIDADGKTWQPYLLNPRDSQSELATVMDTSNVQDGETVQVGYRNTSGVLTIKILNDGDKVKLPDVKLSGPMNAFIDTSASVSLNLPEGNYTLSGIPDTFEQNGMQYTVKTSGTNLTVSAGQETVSNITFTPKNSILDLETFSPSGVPASGILTLPDGSTQTLTLTGQQQVQITREGRYTLTPKPITVNGVTYTAERQSSIIYFGKRLKFTVNYDKSGGSVKFTMPTLPGLTPPYPVTVNNIAYTMADDNTLGLPEGTYSLSFPDTTTVDGVRYLLRPSPSTITVQSGQITPVTVTGTAEKGTLQVTFQSDLVNGQRVGSVSVKDPSGQTSTLTPSGNQEVVQLTDLTPGTYTLTFKTTHSGYLPTTETAEVWVPSRSVRTAQYTITYGSEGTVTVPVYASKEPANMATQVFGILSGTGVSRNITGAGSLKVAPGTYTARMHPTVNLSTNERLQLKTTSELPVTVTSGSNITLPISRYQYQKYVCVNLSGSTCTQYDWVDATSATEKGNLTVVFDSPIVEGQRSGSVTLKDPQTGTSSTLAPQGSNSFVTFEMIDAKAYNLTFNVTHPGVKPDQAGTTVTVNALSPATSVTVRYTGSGTVKFPIQLSKTAGNYTALTYGTFTVDAETQNIPFDQVFEVPYGTYTAKFNTTLNLNSSERYVLRSEPQISVSINTPATIASTTRYQYQQYVCTWSFLGVCVTAGWQDR